MIGRVIGLEESRQLFVIRDTKGNVAEMKPELGSDVLRLRLSLDLPSGRVIEFSVPAPVELLPYLNEITIPRSVEELSDQLDKDLSGVEDDHDKAVKQAEGDEPYLKRKAQGYSSADHDLAEALARKISGEESP